MYQAVQDEIKISNESKTSLSSEDLSFLMLSGRNIYHKQGFKGKGIKIAVLDTGCNKDHPEITHAIKEGYNFTDINDKNDFADLKGHGTHVAGTLVGKACGIAPEAEIIPMRVLSPLGGQIAWIVNALNYCGSRDDIDIITMSLSCGFSESQWAQQEMLHKAIKNCVDNGIAVICAAGNTGIEEKRYPAAFNEPITVGAIDAEKNIACFTTQGDQVDVCQIGVNVWSANYQGGYCTMSGTSMATPIVTGIAALIACKHKALFAERIPENVLYWQLKQNTIDIGTAGLDKASGAGVCTLNQGFNKIIMTVGSKEYTVNGTIKQMDTTPFINANERTMVPVRFAVEDKYIKYNGLDKTIRILG